MDETQNFTSGMKTPAPNLTELSIVSVIFFSAFIVGLICNVLTFLLTLIRQSKSRFHTIFIANLAVADFLCGLIGPAQWLAHFFIFDSSYRHTVRLVFEASQTLGVLSVSAISIDRACVALWPVRYYKRNHRVAPWMILCGLWLSALVVHLSLLGLTRGWSSDATTSPDSQYYSSTPVLSILCVEFLVPLGALLASNIIINVKVSQGRTVRRSLPASLSRSAGSDNNCPDLVPSGSLRPLMCSRRMSSPNLIPSILRERRASSVAVAAQALREFRRRRMSALPSDSQRLRDQEEFIRHVFQKKQYRTLKILVVFVLIFVVCRLPRIIFIILICANSISSLEPKTVHNIIFYLNLLLQINASLDPIVYSFWGNRLYKRRVKPLFRRTCKRCRELFRVQRKPTWV